MYKQKKIYKQLLIFILDILLLNFIFSITLFLFKHSASFNSFSSHLNYLFFLNISWILLSNSLRLYNDSVIIRFELFVKRTAQVYFVWITAGLFFLVFTREIQFSRLFIILSLLNFSIGLSINRFLYFGLRNFLLMQSNLSNKVIILGYNETAKKLASYFEEEEENTQLVGFVEDSENMSELSNYPILSNVEDIINVATEFNVSEIYSTLSPELNTSIYDLINQAEKKCMRFKIVPNLSYFLRKPVIIDYIRDLPILSLRNEPLEDIGNRVKKRFFDLIVSSLTIILILSWLIPLLGILILLESRGPIFFAQLRTGKNDKPFKCFKFRSMKSFNDSESKQATRNDFRVTRIGKFIRKTSLDEFPQFINVLTGKMSIVGPRPHMIQHTSDFSKVVDHYMVRQFLKPGITGWAQINSFRGEITHQSQLEMRIASDLWYLEHWTIWLDVRILFLTVYQVFKGDKNAY